MSQQKRLARLRDSGLTPTIQRIAVLDCLERTRTHPTADQVLAEVREQFPSISRATVYNTLEALTQAGLILRITVDPSVARYDADLGPHMHFRCRLCSTVYDIEVDRELDQIVRIEGHHVESVRTYAYGTCKECLNQGKAAPVNAAESCMKQSKHDHEKASPTFSASAFRSDEGGGLPDA